MDHPVSVVHHDRASGARVLAQVDDLRGVGDDYVDTPQHGLTRPTLAVADYANMAAAGGSLRRQRRA